MSETAKKVKRLHVFVLKDPSEPPQLVCQINHKDETTCERAHSLPADVAWSGIVPSDQIGDFRIDLREAKKRHRSKVRHWQRTLRLIKETMPVPAFAAYHRKMIADQLKAKPVFTFSWKAQ